MTGYRTGIKRKEQRNRVQCLKFRDYKYKAYMETKIKKKKFVPACTKYASHTKWAKNPRFATTKGKKLRWLFHMLKEQKQKPAPNAYPDRPKERVIGACLSQDRKTYIGKDPTLLILKMR